MPTIEEIRTEWHGVRSALGNLICYMDGKTKQFGNAEQTWQKGYDVGHKDGYKQGFSDGVDSVQIPPMTNADMFRQVFPGVDSIDKLVKIVMNASDRRCMTRSEWWDEPYTEAEEGET